MNKKQVTKFSLLAAAVIIGSAFGYCYFCFQFWTHLDTSGFRSLAEYEGSRIFGHRGAQVLVHKSFLPVLGRIEDHAKKNNVALIITQSYRPPARRIKDAVVAPAVKSNHLAGHAVDFNVRYRWTIYESEDLMKNSLGNVPANVRAFIEALRTDESIRWGGDFTTEDPIHTDDSLNQNQMEKWEVHRVACANDYLHATPKWKLMLNALSW